MVQMAPGNMALLFSSLDTGFQHAVIHTPDNLFYLVVFGPTMIH